MRGLLVPSIVHVAGPSELGEAKVGVRLRVRCLRCDGLLYSGLEGDLVPWKLGQLVLETEDDGVTRFQLRESTSSERLAGERICSSS